MIIDGKDFLHVPVNGKVTLFSSKSQWCVIIHKQKTDQNATPSKCNLTTVNDQYPTTKLNVNMCVTLDAKAQDVWDSIGDFNAYPSWWSLMLSSNIRIVGSDTFRDLVVAGVGSITDRLVAFSNDDRCYTYELTDPGSLPLYNYQATLSVHPVSDTKCVFSYNSQFNSTLPEPDARSLVEGILQTATDSLAKHDFTCVPYTPRNNYTANSYTMVSSTLVLPCNKCDVWKYMGDFGEFPSWSPIIGTSTTTTTATTTLRDFVTADGVLNVQEELVGKSDAQTTSVYKINSVAGPAPSLSDYNATLAVCEIDCCSSAITWHASFSSVDLPTARGFVQDVFSAGLNNLKTLDSNICTDKKSLITTVNLPSTAEYVMTGLNNNDIFLFEGTTDMNVKLTERFQGIGRCLTIVNTSASTLTLNPPTGHTFNYAGNPAATSVLLDGTKSQVKVTQVGATSWIAL